MGLHRTQDDQPAAVPTAQPANASTQAATIAPSAALRDARIAATAAAALVHEQYRVARASQQVEVK